MGPWVVFKNRLWLRNSRRRQLILLVQLLFLILLLYLLLPSPRSVPLTPVSARHVRAVGAYLDPRLGLVRVIAAAQVRPLPLLFCAWADEQRQRVGGVERGSVSSLVPEPSTNYDGLFIDCPLPWFSPTPRFIAISTNATGVSPSSFMRITEVPSWPPASPSIGACVCPLHGDGSWVSPRHLTSWIEMNRLLGVDHFVFYNYSAPSSLQPLFRHYTQLGVVDIQQWQLSPIPVSEISMWPPPRSALHYYGQLVAFNECLYRLLHRFRFVMFIDLDELLVPAPPTSLSDFLDGLDSSRYTSFSFRGSYMRSDFPAESVHGDILFLRRGTREQRVLKWNLAPKMVVKPHRVLRMAVHEILRAYPEFWLGVKHVNPENGLLMHYRDPPAYLQQSISGVRDTRVVRLRDQLLRRVRQVLQQVYGDSPAPWKPDMKSIEID